MAIDSPTILLWDGNKFGELWVYFLRLCYSFGDYRRALSSAQTTLSGDDLKSALVILNTTVDVMHDTDEKISKLEYIREDSANTAPFEVGYLMYIIQEKYRMMVDKFNTSTYIKQRLYVMELVIILEEIERHYWQIEHISNMMHEIERKYQIASGLHVKYDDTVGDHTDPHGEPSVHVWKTKRFKMDKFLKNWLQGSTTTKKKHKKWWDLDYGWEIDYYW